MRYSIQGESMPVVICDVDEGETMITEKGSMVWMSNNMEMKTNAGGGIGKMFGRLFSGESAFRNTYTAKGGPGMIAFASSFPGNIKAVEVTPDRPVVAQKTAFLAATEGIETSVFFQKKISAGLFGGEGFIMQKISGNGIVFLEIDGSATEYDLAPGQQLVVDTGNLAMMSATCQLEIRKVSGVKNVLFGGEGLFNTVVTGPGKVLLQSMPLMNFVEMIAAHMPKQSSNS